MASGQWPGSKRPPTSSVGHGGENFAAGGQIIATASSGGLA